MRVLFPEPSNYDRQTGLLLSTPQMERYYGMYYTESETSHIAVEIISIEYILYLIEVFCNDCFLIKTDPSSGIRGRNGGMFARSKNMEHLKKIIQNKSFLITLIRTLEAQRTFTMKDK